MFLSILPFVLDTLIALSSSEFNMLYWLYMVKNIGVILSVGQVFSPLHRKSWVLTWTSHQVPHSQRSCGQNSAEGSVPVSRELQLVPLPTDHSLSPGTKYQISWLALLEFTLRRGFQGQACPKCKLFVRLKVLAYRAQATVHLWFCNGKSVSESCFIMGFRSLGV